MRKLRRVLKRLKYAWKIGLWGYKSTPWNEYDKFFDLICFQLEVMAEEFERLDYTESCLQDAKDMRKVIRLIKSGIQETRHNKYLESVYFADLDGWEEPLKSIFRKGVEEDIARGKRPYDYGTCRYLESQDQRAIELALKLIAYKYTGWWQ